MNAPEPGTGAPQRSAQQSGRVHYIHRLSYTAQERLVGAFVLSGLLLLFVAAVFSREATNLFADKFLVNAYMKDARGVTVDTQVLISGVQVGRVRALEVVGNDLIRLELEMLERFHPLLHEDAKAALSKLSMIGKPSIEVHGGSPNVPPMPEGGTIPLTEPPNIDQILANLAPAMSNVQNILERLSKITGAVEPEHVTAVTRNLGTASTEVPALVREARGVVGQMQSTMTTINYETQQLPDLVVRSRQLMLQMDRTLHGVQNTWPVSSAMAPASEQQIVDPRPMP
jgi:phospholipid/cholesterol/gamma-HCH transport system substrate-binding protein